MKYTFIYNGKSWFLEIHSLETLNAYMDMVWNLHHEDLLYDIKRLRENKHPTSDIITLCNTLASMKDSDVWHEFMILKEKQRHDMTDMILKNHTLYVNTSGGYCLSLDEKVNRYESDVLIWPVLKESDIQIKQWPGGTHFYAYIGPIQVKYDDQVKWDSESDARMAALSYVNKRQKVK